MSRPHGYPHNHHGSGGGMWDHPGSGSHHGSGGGMWGHNGGTGRPTPVKFSHHYGGGYGAGGMTVEEVEREECRYEYRTSPTGMHVKEQYASNYANHGGGTGHGPGHYMGGMGGYPKPQAEWVSKAL
ncbi:hypothetical protein CRG98_002629 [Punica granatum]|nr:hypothetical protein CRG98_002629 [Punica granatum]